jgi:hypothetical protein
MRGYEDSSQDLYDEDFPDQVEQKSTFRRRVIGILLISLGLVGTTVAANISLSNGRIEMGQGVYRIKACDQWVGIGLFPTATSGGLSYVQTVELIGLDPRLCKNVLFQIKMYKNSDPTNPLSLFNGVTGTDTGTATTTVGNVKKLSIYDTATVSYPATTTYNTYARRALTLVNEANVNVGYGDEHHNITYVSATGVYRIFLNNPLALMADVDRITIESATLSS